MLLMQLQKFWIVVLLCFSGCSVFSTAPQAPSAPFMRGDLAPEMVGVEWLDKGSRSKEEKEKRKDISRTKNQDANSKFRVNESTNPQINDLHGSVVLLNFWSYDCGFCREVIGWIQEWQETYSDTDLQVIGIHTPEYAYEKRKKNVERAVEKLNITYPVALDNQKQTWKVYQNKYRPAIYLIDREGKLQFLAYGTGKKAETIEMLEALLSKEKRP